MPAQHETDARYDQLGAQISRPARDQYAGDGKRPDTTNYCPLCEQAQREIATLQRLCDERGQDLASETRRADAAAAAGLLTVANVLKQLQVGLRVRGYLLQWADDRTSQQWEIWDVSGHSVKLVFSNADESAACAEFLRLTDAQEKTK
jgi:hypothetical protein